MLGQAGGLTLRSSETLVCKKPPSCTGKPPTLTRNGYDAPALTTLLNAKPAEVRDFLAGTPAGDRTREFTDQLRIAGVPV